MNSKTINKQYKYYGMWPVAPTPFFDNGEVKHSINKDKIEGMQVKVKRMSTGLFKVKTRIAPEFTLGGGTNEKNTTSRKRNSKKRKAKVNKASI